LLANKKPSIQSREPHTITTRRLARLGHGLLLVLGAGLGDQVGLVLVLAVYGVDLLLGCYRALVVESVGDTGCEGGPPEDL